MQYKYVIGIGAVLLMVAGLSAACGSDDDSLARCNNLLGFDETANACDGITLEPQCAAALARPEMTFRWSFDFTGTGNDSLQALACARDLLSELDLPEVEDTDGIAGAILHTDATAAEIEPMLSFSMFPVVNVGCLDETYCDCGAQSLGECEAHAFCVQWEGEQLDLEAECRFESEPVGCITIDWSCILMGVFGISPDGECYLFGGCLPENPGWRTPGPEDDCGADYNVMPDLCEAG